VKCAVAGIALYTGKLSPADLWRKPK